MRLPLREISFSITKGRRKHKGQLKLNITKWIMTFSREEKHHYFNNYDDLMNFIITTMPQKIREHIEIGGTKIKEKDKICKAWKEGVSSGFQLYKNCPTCHFAGYRSCLYPHLKQRDTLNRDEQNATNNK